MKVSRINNSLPKSSFKDYSKEIKAALVKKASTKRGFNIEKNQNPLDVTYHTQKIKSRKQYSRAEWGAHSGLKSARSQYQTAAQRSRSDF